MDGQLTNWLGALTKKQKCYFFVCVLMCFLGDAQFSEAVGYPMVQQWRVRSNLYKVKLSSITLSTGFCLIAFISFFNLPSQSSLNKTYSQYIILRKENM